jgi:hypothetical protein
MRSRLFKNAQMLFAINYSGLLASTAVFLNHAIRSSRFEENGSPILNRPFKFSGPILWEEKLCARQL